MEALGRVIAVEFPWNWVVVAAIVALFVLVGLVAWWQSARDQLDDSHGSGGPGGGTPEPPGGGGHTG